MGSASKFYPLPGSERNVGMAERGRKGLENRNGIEATCSVLDRRFILGNIQMVQER